MHDAIEVLGYVGGVAGLVAVAWAILIGIRGLMKRVNPWQYGWLGASRARMNIKTGDLEFVLWKAGEHGHRKDYWHLAGEGHQAEFVPDDEFGLALQRKLVREGMSRPKQKQGE